MKRTLRDLAIFGGSPAFPEALHVGRPNIGNRDRLLGYLDDLLESRWLTNHGPMVQQLEQRICQLLGVKHCIAMCNATVALEIVIRALGLTGEVLVPSFTFIATAHALQWQEITPVFCDVDPYTHNLDPCQIEQMITPRTSGIIGVHLWGRPCPVAELTTLARRHHLKLIFDAAHAFGCSYQGQMVGNFGDAEVFSFHATKFFNTFEGGAVVTNNDEIAAKVRLMSNFGFAGYDNVIYIGTNGKMSEVSAAMGLTGLEALPAFVATNRANYRQYQQELTAMPALRLIDYDEAEQCNYQYIVVEIEPEATSLQRDQLIKILHAEQILARRYFYPGCHKMEPYRSYFPHAGLLLPVTENLSRRLLLLPTGTTVGPETIATIGQILRFAMAHSAAIVEQWPDEGKS